MPQLASHYNLDVSRLLFDLKRCGDLVNRFTGWLDADAIATCVTEGLIEQFDCAFTRIWLIEPDRRALRLVASSGLYTRLDGAFARVPMGAFKVGKIAEHCIPFLSNRLSDEAWVKDRDWAIENNIQGFAGLPLMESGQAIGVLAVFNTQPMAPEFLEVLQLLSLSVSGALASALNHQTAMEANKSSAATLSEQLVSVLGQRKLSLLGTEQTLAASVAQLITQMAVQMAEACHYCRLVYEADSVVLEAMMAADMQAEVVGLDEVSESARSLGGTLQIENSETVVKVRLQLPQAPVHDLSQDRSLLSAREQEVLELLASGARDREMAEQLFISERTVKFHIKNMLNKLGVKTRSQAVFTAVKKNWIR
ncbi:MAG: LuxR C-terminal-related transcriptional regulator [Phormidesmis sp.]